MKKVIYLILCVLFKLNSISQVPTIQWQNNYGLGGEDVAKNIKYSTLGFYVLAGYTNHNYDASLFKIDTLGNIIWANNYGGTLDEQASQVLITYDNKIVFLGEANSNDGDVSGVHGPWPFTNLIPDYWLVCLDSSGTIEWQKCLGGTGPDQGYSIIQTPDSGFFLTGTIEDDNGDVNRFIGSNDVWVVKTDKYGNLLWRRTIGGTYNDFGNKCLMTSDGGYIIGATSESADVDVTGNHGSYDAWIVKLNSIGVIQWEKSYGGSGVDGANDLILGLNGDFYIIGSTNSIDGDISGAIGNADVLVMKIDSIGNIIWQKCIGGSQNEEGRSGCLTTNGGVQVVGYTFSNDGDAITSHGNKDVLSAELDSNGNLLWSKCFGGSADDEGYSVIQTTDGGTIFSGYTSSTDGDAVGNFSNNHRDWVVKLSPLPVNIPTINSSSINLHGNIKNNSALVTFELDNEMSVKLSFYDTTGRKLFEKVIRAHQGTNKIQEYLPMQKNGIIIQLETHDASYSKLIY